MKTAEVEANVLILHILDFATAGLLEGDDGLNGPFLCLRVGFEISISGCVALRMWQCQSETDALDPLQGESPLPGELTMVLRRLGVEGLDVTKEVMVG